MSEQQQKNVQDLWDDIHTPEIMQNCLNHFAKTNRIQDISPWDELETLFYRMLNRFELGVNSHGNFERIDLDLFRSESLLPRRYRISALDNKSSDKCETNHAHAEPEASLGGDGEEIIGFYEFDQNETGLNYKEYETLFEEGGRKTYRTL